MSFQEEPKTEIDAQQEPEKMRSLLTLLLTITTTTLRPHASTCLTVAFLGATKLTNEGKVQAFTPAEVARMTPPEAARAATARGKDLQKASSTSLSMSDENEQDLLRWARAKRSADADDNVVELMRPLGLVLNEDDAGNVYVETVAPKGNAARTGQVKEGDILTMCSATFGDQMWSCRGVGLTRVLAAIRVRAGPTVKLVFETPGGYKKKAAQTAQQRKAAEKAAKAAQAKKDKLLSELEETETKLKKGKFFGLF